MNNKKLLALLLAMIFILVMITGCSSSGTTDETTPGDSTGTPVATDTSKIDMAYLSNVLAKGSAISEGVSYDMKITAAGQTNTMSYAMEGDKIRTAGSFNGVESVMIIDSEKMISYDPVAKTGMMFAIGDKGSTGAGTIPTNPETSGAPDTNLNDNFDSNSLVFESKGEFDGEECLIVAAKDPTGAGTIKLWVNERLGMVVKMEGTSADGQLFSTELTNVKVGKQPEDKFDVPADIKIVEIPAM
jgi:outer membrane lipoprotein-sorting protein